MSTNRNRADDLTRNVLDSLDALPAPDPTTPLAEAINTLRDYLIPPTPGPWFYQRLTVDGEDRHCICVGVEDDPYVIARSDTRADALLIVYAVNAYRAAASDPCTDLTDRHCPDPTPTARCEHKHEGPGPTAGLPCVLNAGHQGMHVFGRIVPECGIYVDTGDGGRCDLPAGHNLDHRPVARTSNLLPGADRREPDSSPTGRCGYRETFDDGRSLHCVIEHGHSGLHVPASDPWWCGEHLSDPPTDDLRDGITEARAARAEETP